MRISGKRITAQVHALRLPFGVPVGPGQVVERFVYAFLIYGREVCLIDSGTASAGEPILAYLRQTGHRPEEVTRLVLTHSHPDHIGAARAVQAASGCLVAAHAAERDWIENVEQQARERPVPGFNTLVGGPVAVDLELADGDRLDLGSDLSLEVHHTPGHSAGSISLLLSEERVLIAGDAVPVPGDLPIYEDVSASVRSLRKLQALAGVDVLLASWDEPRRGKEAGQAIKAGLDHLQRLHDLVLDAAGDDPRPDPLAICKRLVAAAVLPSVAANPLVARSVAAHLAMRHQRQLVGP